MDKFKCCVKKAQERILWLNKEEVEKKVCYSHSRYLGYPMQDIHYQLQSAMSQEQSFDNDGQWSVGVGLIIMLSGLYHIIWQPFCLVFIKFATWNCRLVQVDNLNTGCLHYWQCKYRLSTILAVQGVPVVYNFGSASTGCLQCWQCKYRLSTILAVQVPVVYNFVYNFGSARCWYSWDSNPITAILLPFCYHTLA